MMYNDIGIKNLAFGIVEQAVNDYKKSLVDPRYFKYRHGLESFSVPDGVRSYSVKKLIILGF